MGQGECQVGCYFLLVFFLNCFCVGGVRWVLNGSGRVSGGVLLFLNLFIFLLIFLCRGCQVGVKWVREGVRWGVIFFKFYFIFLQKFCVGVSGGC